MVGAILKWPPLRASRIAAKTLAESKRGKQNQSIDPSMADEGGRVHVSNDPIVLDRLISHVMLSPTEESPHA